MILLTEVDSIALQSTIRYLADAFSHFLRNRMIFHDLSQIRIKSNLTKQTNRNIAVIENRIKLAKVGLVKFAKTREVTGSIPNASVRRDSSRIYFVSLLVEKDIQKLPKTGSPLGLMWD